MTSQLIKTKLSSTKTEISQGEIIVEDNVLKSVESFTEIDKYCDVKNIFDTLKNNSSHVIQVEADSSKKITFGEMKDNSVSLAIWLTKQGVKSGDVVALCSSDHSYVYNILLAAMFVQATYTPWDSATDLELARYFLKLTQPKILFVSEKKVKILQKAIELEDCKIQIISLDHSDGFLNLENIIALQTAEEIANFEIIDNTNPEQRVASILFSSGTTGPAKGVMLSTQARARRILTSDRGDKLENSDQVCMFFLAPSWDVHIQMFLYGIVTKVTQILHNNFSEKEIPAIINDYKVQTLYSDLYSMMLLVDACIDSDCTLESVTTVIIFGAKISQRVENKIHNCMPNVCFFKVMGSTESGLIASSRRPCKNPLSTGVIAPGVQLKIKDLQTGEKLGINKTGELYVKTPWIMTCYFKDPATTKSSLDDEGFFRTGDEAYYDENGELVIVGRIKDIIGYRNFLVHPVQIELILKSHPHISDVAVVGVPHDVDSYRAVAFLVTIPDKKVNEDELIQMISHLELEDFLKGCIYFIEKLPYNTNGKVNRHALKELAKKCTNFSGY